MADGLFLGLVSYGALGLSTSFEYAVVVHLVVVTLLASFRTGLKLAVWHTMLVVTAYQLHLDGVAPLPDGAVPATWSDVLIFLAVAWALTGATAAAGAANERELRRRNYDLKALADFSLLLESATEPDEVAHALVSAVVEEFAMPRAVLLAAGTGPLAALALHGVELPDLEGGADGDRVVRDTMQSRYTHRVVSLHADDEPWLCAAMPGARNVITIPLVAEDAPVGTLVLEYGRHHGARIERRTVTMIERFASQASLALNNAWLLAQVRATASTDALTGVANRRSFDQQLDREFSRAERRGTPLAVALLDVDHFKKLNDTYGHQTGDVALQRVAAAVSSAVRAEDLVARYGGEEFVVIMPSTDSTDGQVVAERVRAAIEALLEEPRVTVSVGVADYPVHASEAKAVVAAADAALYAAKRSGRNRVAVADGAPAEVVAA